MYIYLYILCNFLAHKSFLQADARSSQHFCEVIPLNFLIITFLVVGRACFLNMRSAHQQLKIAGKKVQNAELSIEGPKVAIIELCFIVYHTLYNASPQSPQSNDIHVAEAKSMAQAIVHSSLSSLRHQRRRLFISVCVVPAVAFIPRAG